MSVLNELKAADWAIIFATLLGPVLAVQAQKWLEALRERRNAKHRVFAQLMATRKERLSPDHVRGLNMIALTFYGAKYFKLRLTSKTETAVLRAWKAYFDHLHIVLDEHTAAALTIQREELFIDLLAAMAMDLGYDLDKVELKRGAYSPNWHGIVEDEGNRLRKSLVEVFEGQRPIGMHIVNFPPTAAGEVAPTSGPGQRGDGGSTSEPR
ncbi:DUF6680 family protein [Ramlibacter sp.]|uniref:DUF6680 family protein n=1 Tax=Ramlibacter sp. TaxID=1917967 RepID=UPI002FCBF186